MNKISIKESTVSKAIDDKTNKHDWVLECFYISLIPLILSVFSVSYNYILTRNYSTPALPYCQPINIVYWAAISITLYLNHYRWKIKQDSLDTAYPKKLNNAHSQPLSSCSAVETIRYPVEQQKPSSQS